jgi:hypothetical protein
MKWIQAHRPAADRAVDPEFKLHHDETIPPEYQGEWLALQDEIVVAGWYRRLIENEMAQRPVWTTIGVVGSIVGALLALLLAWASSAG